jgi:hypothetical protein
MYRHAAARGFFVTLEEQLEGVEIDSTVVEAAECYEEASVSPASFSADQARISHP